MTATPSILLVHGGAHGPWCWDNFVEHLSRRGHDVRTIQLRGHHGPPGRIWYRIHHYVKDVERAAVEFSSPPILVGHSMGGLVVQKYLERNPAHGAVLMASVPPQGTIRATARLARQQPLVFLQSTLLLRLQPFIGTSQLVRELFFTAETPQEIVDHCFMHLQDESYLAFIDTMIELPRPRHIQVPVLVLGAERDALLTVSEVQATARAYRTEAKMFFGMGHDMMLDQGWHRVADQIACWVRTISSSDAKL
jgi:pimeloyl-ACP methyl ester carboxylesterase